MEPATSYTDTVGPANPASSGGPANPADPVNPGGPGSRYNTGTDYPATTYPPPPVAPKRLTRQDGKISGVCGGLGEYIGVDPTLVRLGVILGSVLTFPVLPVAYLGAWVVMPEHQPAPLAPLNQPAAPVVLQPTEATLHDSLH